MISREQAKRAFRAWLNQDYGKSVNDPVHNAVTLAGKLNFDCDFFRYYIPIRLASGEAREAVLYSDGTIRVE